MDNGGTDSRHDSIHREADSLRESSVNACWVASFLYIILELVILELE